MRQLLQAIVLIIAFAYLRSKFSYTPAETFFNILFYGSIIYLVIAVVNTAKAGGNNAAPQQASTTNINPAINTPGNQQNNQHTNNDNSGIWLIGIALLGALLYFFREIVGQKSFQSLLFVDNLLKLNNAVPPVFMWCILGLFTGLIYGSVVALKKYRLTLKVVLIPATAMLLFLVVMFFINKPLNTKPVIIYQTHRQTAYNFITVNASSIRSTGKINYVPGNLVDQDDNTAWASESGNTNNQVVKFTFADLATNDSKNVRCVGFKIKNGYRKSRQTWESFGRLEWFAILLNDGSVYNTKVSAYDYDADSQDIMIVPFPLQQNDVISIRIQSIYPGKNHPTQVAVSELIPIIEYEER